MSNEDIIEDKQKGFLARFTSVLSNNRMFISVITILYLFPLITRAELSPERDLLNVITQIMIFGLLAMSFDLQLGRAGLLNFGHVALFGVGAYFIAFTLNNAIFPELNILPFPLTLVIAMLIGAFLGFIMGLTTSRMRGTAFAFIALAIAMFLYNFFAQNPTLSGGETGLRVATPSIMTTAPFYLFFIIITFIILTAFFGMVINYVKIRTESSGLLFFVPVMVAFIGFLLFFGANIIGSVLVFVAMLGMFGLYWMERSKSIRDPLQIEEGKQVPSSEITSVDIISKYVLPLSILAITIVGFLVAFWNNIYGMAILWIEDTDIFLYRIPVMYYLVLTCVVLTFIFIKRLIASPFGRMVTAVAQNQERAEALGYNSYRSKIVVVMISGAIAALAGGLYAPFIRTIDPTAALGVEISIDAMLYTIIGGIATILGPLLGAGVVVYSELNLVDFMDSIGLPGELWVVGLGIIYIIIVLFLPLGITGSVGIKTQSLKERLQRIKIGSFEFGMKEMDYWVPVVLGSLVLLILLLFFTINI
ncbi:branched-chain amino acid ABC transporter permease [Candidatus Thorarchaeota archaeon]|nr:MAG: branched-chain amino acid ABC transporter permease [Candidatus Thorarchaeota archaeon]